MALMYPYRLRAVTSRHDDQTREFTEDHPRYYFCCCHVGNSSTVLTVFTIIFCLVSVGFFTAGILLPNSHEYLYSRHVNLEFKNRPQTFRRFYHITLAVLLAGSSVHLLTSILCLVGIRSTKPNFIVPELIVTGLFVGLILFATISLTISMVILLGFLLVLTIIDAVLILYATYYFYTLLITYHYVRDKRRSWSRASSRYRHSNYDDSVKNAYFHE